MNILISGGTSSGKTTIARALLAMSHKDERLITIEDAVELRPEHINAVALVASRRKGSDRSTAKLLESSLRMRPDRLIVGELRGAEAYNFLEGYQYRSYWFDLNHPCRQSKACSGTHCLDGHANWYSIKPQ